MPILQQTGRAGTGGPELAVWWPFSHEAKVPSGLRAMGRGPTCPVPSPAWPSERGAANAPDLRVPKALPRPEGVDPSVRMSAPGVISPTMFRHSGQMDGFNQSWSVSNELQSGGKKARESRDVLGSEAEQSWISGG